MFSYLFAYGKLKPGYSPPKTMEDPKIDEVQGRMFVRKDHETQDPALVHPNDPTAPLVQGILMKVSPGELYDIDKEETGYSREQVLTRSGKKVWTYIWRGHVPSNAELITHWDDPNHPARRRL
jgi:gamma-glutamylcyclotransferase (GGCT)/AIG2-like uncharacterized protein YtfP